MEKYKKEFIGKIPVWAIITQKHKYYERRVYIDEKGNRYVKYNGLYLDICEAWTKFGINVDICF